MNDSVKSIADIKKYVKLIFKNVDLLNNGFALDCITVIFHSATMDITNFDEKTGKATTGYFLHPNSYGEIKEKIIHHCGEEKVNKQLRPNITIAP